MIPLQNPESLYEEDYHRHEFYTDGDKREHIATIEFDDIEDERGGLWCEVSVWLRMGVTTSEPLVAFERANLLAKGSTLKTILNNIENVGSVNWKQGFDTATFKTITAYRSDSSETAWMERRVATEEDSPYLLEPFIARTGVTVLFAPKGTGKSTFALKLALGVASGLGFNGHLPTENGPVMYLDFEDTAKPHEFRLSAMTDDKLDGLIRHVRITKSLKDARRLLRRMVRDDKVSLVVLDSVALARAADVSGSEATIKMFKTLAQLGVPVLAIDHMTKEDNKRVATGQMDARQATPIGSQFTESSARLAWFMNELPQSTAETKVFNLFNTKNNHGPKSVPLGMTVKIVQGEHQQMESVTYVMDKNTHDAVIVEATKMTMPQKLLVWHYKQQRLDDKTGKMVGVIPMTGTQMEKSGISGSTIRGAITGNPWWEKVSGGKQYVLTTLGLEAAGYFSSMFGQTRTETEDDND
jgi:hypothetical protein